MKIFAILRNTWFRILLGLIIGPPLAVCVAKVIITPLRESGTDGFCSLLLCLLIIVVIIKAVVIRAVTGIRLSSSYSISLLIGFLNLVLLVLYSIVVDLNDPYCGFVFLPIFSMAVGIAYCFLTGPNRLGIIYSSVTVVISVLVGLYMSGVYGAPYPAGLPNNLVHHPVLPSWMLDFLNLVPLLLILPMIEAWPAYSFLPMENAMKAVFLSHIAVIFFFANAFIFTYFAMSWLTS